MFVKVFACVIFPVSAVQCVWPVLSVTIKYTFLWLEYGVREAVLKTAGSVYSSTLFIAIGFCGLHVIFLLFSFF
jgi:heme/copper-type cytochrome/quinol oxidase subunit 3